MTYKMAVDGYIKSTLRALVNEFLESKEWTESEDLEMFLEWYNKTKLGDRD